MSSTTTSLPIPAKARLTRELHRLSTDPPPGIAAYLPNTTTNTTSDMTQLHAEITGPESSPFANGTFHLTVHITPRYPFEPPRIRFLTPLYHPNIDSAGRICLDTLKSPPAGSWSPAVSLPSLLLSIRALMAEPNPDDGLVPEISELYKRDLRGWEREARRRTKRDAMGDDNDGKKKKKKEGGGDDDDDVQDSQRDESEKEGGTKKRLQVEKNGLEDDSSSKRAKN